MSTISELMAGKKPGEINIRASDWDTDSWFRPYFFANEVWHGKKKNGNQDYFNDAKTNWIIYTEPKAKVVWHEYLITPVKPDEHNKGYVVWLHDQPAKPSRDQIITKTGRTVEVEG